MLSRAKSMKYHFHRGFGADRRGLLLYIRLPDCKSLQRKELGSRELIMIRQLVVIDSYAMALDWVMRVTHGSAGHVGHNMWLMVSSAVYANCERHIQLGATEWASTECR